MWAYPPVHEKMGYAIGVIESHTKAIAHGFIDPGSFISPGSYNRMLDLHPGLNFRLKI
jgi:hypothetical protein